MEVKELLENVKAWEWVKQRVYPILLPAKWNEEVIKSLVYREMLDLYIVYIIRNVCGERSAIKVKGRMLAGWGISEDELFRQAIKNLKADTYGIVDIDDFVKEEDMSIDNMVDVMESGVMYILSNKKMYFGAAGILNKEYLQKIAGNRNLYIIPSSINEVILICDDGEIEKEMVDEVIKIINAEVLPKEKWLSNHCYYYDFEKDEIKVDAD